jgi:hypothetical protein
VFTNERIIDLLVWGTVTLLRKGQQRKGCLLYF